MKRVLLFFGILVATCVAPLSINAATRTWIGAGAGGAGTDFNNAANWSPAGPLLATDDYVMTLSSSANVALTNNITVNNFTFTVTGSTNGSLNLVSYVLTVNGPFVCDAVNYSNPTNYSYLRFYVGTGAAAMVCNSSATFHTTGSGITYVYGPAANPGSLKFYGNVTWGPRVRTAAGIEPDMYYDAPVAQTVTVNILTTTTFVMPEDVWYGFANSPVITFAGTSAGTQQMYFGSYDGNVRIKNTTLLRPMYCTLDGFSAVQDFYMDPGSEIEINYTNDFPQGGYNNYFLDNTSTQEYMGVASAQTVTGLTVSSLRYGNLIIAGSGNKTAGAANSIKGNFTVNAGATYLAQTFSHNLWGNFTNNGTFTAGTSTWTMDGTANQNIQGTVSTTFHNLTNNKASGTTFLMINTTVGTSTAAGTMDFQDGPVALNGYRMNIARNATNAVIRTSGYAISETALATNPSIIQWAMGTTTGAFVFPFGKTGGTYIPLTFNKTSATGATVSIATRATGANTNLPWATGVTHMYDPVLGGPGEIAAVVDRWWDINSTAAITADITFSYEGAENTLSAPFQTGSIGAQYWSAAWLPNNATIGSAPAVTAGVGSVTASGLSIAAAFTPWILSSVTAPLPVEIAELSAGCNNGVAVLNWSTASETNNDYFSVERSIDGVTFEEIGRVDGAGYSTQMLNYRFVDAKPVEANTYYRLKQVDFNGQYSYSRILTVDPCAAGNSTINAWYNGSDISIMITTDANNVYNAVLVDMQGREVYSEQLVVGEGVSLKQINPAGVAKGIYLLRVIGADGSVFSEKLILPNR